MFILFTIFHYLVQAAVDVLDKVLITKRKIEPVSYTFFTIITGLVFLAIWPWVFLHLPNRAIFLDVLSGIWFSLAYFVFFKAMSGGEVSRVIPFVFGIMPLFDVAISVFTGKNTLQIQEVAALSLLVPGALLISYKPNSFLKSHVGLKIGAAFMLSSYNALWQYAAQTGTVLNNLMWNRIGAALLVICFLLIPSLRNKIFATKHIEQKKDTSILFIAKQLLGGFSFLFLSFLLVMGKISVVSSLQGFRYIFLFVAGIIFTKYHKHVLEEDVDRHTKKQKLFAIVLICLGTLILFI